MTQLIKLEFHIYLPKKLVKNNMIKLIEHELVLIRKTVQLHIVLHLSLNHDRKRSSNFIIFISFIW